MSTEIKVYLSNKMNENDLCFYASVYSQDDYDVFFDLNETYEPLLEKSLNGSLEIEYSIPKTFEKKYLYYHI